MKSLALLVLGLGLLTPARANLGETPEEFRARFGAGDPVTNTAPDTAEAGLRIQRFTAKGYQIEVLFSEISLQESYFPDDSFTDPQVGRFLEANGEGHTWRKGRSRTSQSWIRDDGAEATLTQSCFIFRSKRLLDEERDWNNQRSANLPGL